MDEFKEFVSDNKWAIIFGVVAIVLACSGAINIILNIVFLAGMIFVGRYFDKDPERIKEFFSKFKGDKEDKGE